MRSHAIKSLCILAMFFISVSAQFSTPDMKPSDPTMPTYRILFENGFYREIIELLESKASDTAAKDGQDQQKILAFSYVLTGQNQVATKVFQRILSADSTFRLNPIEAPPQIYAVFADAAGEFKAMRRMQKPLPTIQDSSQATLETQRPAQISVVDSDFSPWIRYPILLSPAGAGQFYNRQSKKGFALLTLQVATAAGCYWSYSQKDPVLGWTQDNLRYKQATSVQVAVFGATYLYGIIDAIWRNHAK